MFIHEATVYEGISIDDLTYFWQSLQRATKLMLRMRKMMREMMPTSADEKDDIRSTIAIGAIAEALCEEVTQKRSTAIERKKQKQKRSRQHRFVTINEVSLWRINVTHRCVCAA